MGLFECLRFYEMQRDPTCVSGNGRRSSSNGSTGKFHNKRTENQRDTVARRPEWSAPEKKITHKSKAIDQLGNHVGMHQKGDVAKVHVRGHFLATRPLFRLGKKNFHVKQRKVFFLDTHHVGETAFVEVNIGNADKNNFDDDDCDGLGRLIRNAVEGMVFGESAIFTSDNISTRKEPSSSSPQRIIGRSNARICRGHFYPVETDAEVLCLEIDSFRVVRNGKLRARQIRNGYGGRNWAM
eukprot:CAMPEP_0197725438 /NCGR_PEP_ID=MMETSP1434-20131217/6974_1 /TAXON_ID=265543 /ORGANISM="Minutocellus polymorphus, Strain CCMP3303" /LENGTH=238 /DNA_ID=CAMNT_0043310913 /DNA_START=99 /DNA_END=815 /DNA_ORIENTATION=-